ncbi:MAG: hypothetical protein M5U12_32310 [Verrucomicrobia bacterium]|nr:hypothetical protein [Verrucomicrobiota bacterium]
MTGSFALLPQPGEHGFQHPLGPRTLVSRVRREVVRGGLQKTRLRIVAVQGQELDARPTLQGPAPIRFVGEVMRQRRQQKRPKPPLGRVHRREVLPRQQAGEEPLYQILGVLRSITLPSRESVQRIPVGPTECFKRALGLEPLAPART